MKTKAQTTLEFISLFAILLLFFVGGIFITGKKLVELEHQRIEKNSDAIANIVSTEINLAARADGNYTRAFELPILLDNDYYDVNLFEGFELEVLYNDDEFVYPLEHDVIVLDVAPGTTYASKIFFNNTYNLFIGSDLEITVNPMEANYEKAKGTVANINATVSTIFGGDAAEFNFTVQPQDSILEDRLMDKMGFINFTTDFQMLQFGYYYFEVTGYSVINNVTVGPYFVNLQSVWPQFLFDSIIPEHSVINEFIGPLNYSVDLSAEAIDRNEDLTNLSLLLKLAPNSSPSYGLINLSTPPLRINSSIPIIPDPLTSGVYNDTFNETFYFDEFGFYAFTFFAEDSDGNNHSSPTVGIEIVNVPPKNLTVYWEGSWEAVPQYTSWSSDSLNFTDYFVDFGAIDDNHNIMNLSLLVLNKPASSSLENITFMNPDCVGNQVSPCYPNSSYEFNESFNPIFDEWGEFSFKFVAMDDRGLINESMIYYVTLFEPPYYDNDSILPSQGTVFEREEGLEVDFNITYHNKSASLLNKVNLTFWNKPGESAITGDEVNLDPALEDYNFSVTKALDKFGEYEFSFLGRNTFGGFNETQRLFVELRNVPPIVGLNEYKGLYSSTDTGDHNSIFALSDGVYEEEMSSGVIVNNGAGFNFDQDLFFLGTDVNHNAVQVNITIVQKPAGANLSDASFTQDKTSMLWQNFRDHLWFDKFGNYEFYFTIYDELGLNNVSPTYNLTLVNNPPLINQIYEPDGTVLQLATVINPVMSSAQPYNWPVYVSANDQNNNLDDATIEFSSTNPSHADSYSVFVGDTIGNATFSNLDFSEFGNYTFNVTVYDDEGLTEVSTEYYDLQLVNDAPGFTTVTDCVGAVNYESGQESRSFETTFPFTCDVTLSVSDVNENLDYVSVIWDSDESSGGATNPNGLGVVEVNEAGDTITYSLTFYTEGDYFMDVVVVDEEGETDEFVLNYEMQNTWPEITANFPTNNPKYITIPGDIQFSAEGTDATPDLEFVTLVFDDENPADFISDSYDINPVINNLDIGGDTSSLLDASAMQYCIEKGGFDFQGYSSDDDVEDEMYYYNNIDEEWVLETNAQENGFEFIYNLKCKINGWIDLASDPGSHTLSETITIPMAFGTYDYHYEAIDSAGAIASTLNRSVILTNEAPIMVSAEENENDIPETQTLEVPVPHTMDLDMVVSDDNINLDEVYVDLDKYIPGSGWISEAHFSTANNIHGDDLTWQIGLQIVNLPINFSDFGLYRFKVCVNDTESLTDCFPEAQNDYYVVNILNVPPVLTYQSPESGLSKFRHEFSDENPIVLTGTFTDVNHNLDYVSIEFTQANGNTALDDTTVDPLDDSAELTVSFNLTPDMFLGNVGVYEYQLRGVDSEGLETIGDPYTFEIKGTSPIFGSIVCDSPLPTGIDGGSETYDQDYGLLRECVVIVLDDDEDLASLDLIVIAKPSGSSMGSANIGMGGGYGTGNFNLNFDEYGQYKFKFNVSDEAGLSSESGLFTFNLNNQAPVFDNTSYAPTEQPYVGSVDFTSTFSDGSKDLDKLELEIICDPDGASTPETFEAIFDYTDSETNTWTETIGGSFCTGHNEGEPCINNLDCPSSSGTCDGPGHDVCTQEALCPSSPGSCQNMGHNCSGCNGVCEGCSEYPFVTCCESDADCEGTGDPYDCSYDYGFCTPASCPDDYTFQFFGYDSADEVGYSPVYTIDCSTELCNSLDDDCDGVADEGFNVGAACGVGVCSGGVIECSMDGQGTVCSSDDQSQSESCNGLDDDCDGSFMANEHGASTGDEVCNGGDDDCDGEVDEDDVCLGTCTIEYFSFEYWGCEDPDTGQGSGDCSCSSTLVYTGEVSEADCVAGLVVSSGHCDPWSSSSTSTCSCPAGSNAECGLDCPLLSAGFYGCPNCDDSWPNGIISIDWTQE